jgi:4-diphosphocytidyl-2-C-methyl-D-erythritol kinase
MKRMKLIEKACAKVNLALKITGIREDGYHLLDMVLMEAGLYDTLELEHRERGICIEAPEEIPTGMDNTAFRAAAMYFEKTGIRGGAHIRLHKSIPGRAGLGGDSSDAAAVLRLLNRMYYDVKCGKPSLSELHTIAPLVGADVSFFLMGGVQRCKGIGEVLEHIKLASPVHMVILTPNEGLSTPEVYREYDRQPSNTGGDTSLVVEALGMGDIQALCRAMFNDLEAPAERLCPILPGIKKLLLEHGAAGAMMSGSGTSVFGIYESEAESREAAEKIEKKYKDRFRLIHWE